MGINLLGIITIFNLIYGHLAYFNLFLSKAEVKRLLGLKAELFYVREGVTNEYAAGWTVKVPPKIHTIYFQWQSLVKKKIKYEMEILVNKTALAPPHQPIFQPTVNIPLKGFIPKDSSGFTLSIPCTGYVNAELDVLLNINVSAVRRQDPLVMYLRRRKICHRGLSAENFQLRTQDGDKTVPLSFSVYFLATLLTVVLVLSAFFSAVMFKKWILSNHKTNKTQRLKNKRLPLISDNSSGSNDTLRVVSTMNKNNSIHVSEEALYCVPTPLNSDTFSSFYNIPKDSVTDTLQKVNIHQGIRYTPSTNTSCSKRYSSISSNAHLNHICTLSRDKKDVSFDVLKANCFDEKLIYLQMDRSRIKVSNVLQEGTIGQIFTGYLEREHPEMDQKIIIKTVTSTCSSNITKDFIEEGAKLSGIANFNVLSLVGVSFLAKSPPFLIYPDPNGKNFKRFLRDLNQPMKMNDIIHLAVQTSRAVAFLHANNILHRDIAARNCIICKDLHLKISDASLSRYFFPDDYISEDALLRPLRWLAPEAILSASEYSFGCDVWEMGILLWEIATNAEQPYEDISWWRILPHLQAGSRLRAPISVSNEIFSVMVSCWSSIASERSSAIEVSNNFQRIYERIHTLM